MCTILLITDAWHPQVNGVVTTLHNLVEQAEKNGDTVTVVNPDKVRIKFPLPGYKEISLCFPSKNFIDKYLNTHFDHIHIATPEGTLGLSFARACYKRQIPFSASCHTKFPEFIHARLPFVSIDLLWHFMVKLYKNSQVVLTTTNTMVQELKNHGFKQEIRSWTRGVDRDIFYPNLHSVNRRRLLCVSRISPEKNLEDFFRLPGHKTMVGNGPYLEKYRKKYPDVNFVGAKHGEELAAYFRNADIFVFPSRTDTFGVVMIEAISCGTPVAAYPVTGPVDVITNGVNGYLNENLQKAIDNCCNLDRNTVYNSSLQWTWENCYEQFKQTLLPYK